MRPQIGQPSSELLPSSPLVLLGQVPHPRHTIIRIPVRTIILRGHKVPALQAALDKVNIPHLVQLISLLAAAAQHHPATAELLQDSPDVLERVVRPRVGLDALEAEGRERVEHLEEPRRAGEVVDDLLARGVGVAIAVLVEGVDAGGVLIVLVLPQVGVAAVGGDPVAVHEVEEVGLVVGL